MPPGNLGAGSGLKPAPALHCVAGTFCKVATPAGKPAVPDTYCRKAMDAGVLATVVATAEPVTVIGVPATP